jgi:uncharacterized protein (TIGR00251 family)
MVTAARREAELLHVRVQPRARRNEVVGWPGPALRVRVTAAPADGEANRAVTRLLADAFRVPPSSIMLVRGVAARDKLFRVEGLSLTELRGRVERSLVPLPRRRGEREGRP